MPSILIEKRIGSLKYVKEALTEGSTRIGRLEGIAADFKKPTRNGRRYPLELWKRVIASEDFKEGMDTHTILGENDHPEDRVDTSIKEVSIVLTDLTINEEEGLVYAGFDILPTDEGYKLKALLDYGSQIGVSSRGLGDEVQKDGETIIDPDTYVFYAFDAVVTPAVKSARPTVVESVDRQKLIDKFSKDIENATTVVELESLKKVADVTKLPELDSLVESIDIKLNSLDRNNISSQLEADLGSLAKENESLKSKVAELESKLSASNTRILEAKDVISRSRENSLSLTRELSQVNELVAELKKENLSLKRDNRTLSGKLESVSNSHDSAIETVNAKLLSISRKAEKYNSELNSVVEENKRLSSINDNYLKEIDNLKSSNESLRSRLKDDAKQITNLTNTNKIVEDKQSSINNKLAKSNHELMNTLNAYVKARCAQEGISYESVTSRMTKTTTLEEVDKMISEMSDQNLRFAKMPIAIPSQTVKLAESTNSEKLTESDRQTIEFLRAFK